MKLFTIVTWVDELQQHVYHDDYNPYDHLVPRLNQTRNIYDEVLIYNVVDPKPRLLENLKKLQNSKAIRIRRTYENN